MRLRVLVVEDEVDIRRGICIELAHQAEKQITIETFEADDWDSAWQLLEGVEKPHLILTDIMMPSSQRAGLVLIEKLKADSRWRHIPVIVLSARNQSEDILEALKLGAIDYITKPYQTEELFSRVWRAVEHQLQNHESEQATPADAMEQWREAHVKAMRLVLQYWETETQKNKFQFADASGLWRVYIDKKGTCSSKTLDRYLHLSTLPTKPKTHQVERSILYVLNHCHSQNDIRTELERLLDVLGRASAV